VPQHLWLPSVDHLLCFIRVVRSRKVQSHGQACVHQDPLCFAACMVVAPPQLSMLVYEGGSAAATTALSFAGLCGRSACIETSVSEARRNACTLYISSCCACNACNACGGHHKVTCCGCLKVSCCLSEPWLAWNFGHLLLPAGCHHILPFVMLSSVGASQLYNSALACHAWHANAVHAVPRCPFIVWRVGRLSRQVGEAMQNMYIARM
jgi:hypothetical protein